MTISPEIRAITKLQARRTTTSSQDVSADRSSRQMLGLRTRANDESPIPGRFTDMAA